MKNIFIIVIVLIINACYYGVNSKTSEIADLNTDCLDSNTWQIITTRYTFNNEYDTFFNNALESIQNKPFDTDVLYFDSLPKEFIAVSKDHYSVRYVFNPHISNEVLDGFSSKLDENEKKRIRNRVQNLLMEFQCEEGKENSLYLIGSEVGSGSDSK